MTLPEGIRFIRDDSEDGKEEIASVWEDVMPYGDTDYMAFCRTDIEAAEIDTDKKYYPAALLRSKLDAP